MYKYKDKKITAFLTKKRSTKKEPSTAIAMAQETRYKSKLEQSFKDSKLAEMMA